MSAAAPSMLWLGPDKPDDGLTPELVGSKAHGLWRMGRLGLRIPPAFALPTTLCALLDQDPERSETERHGGKQLGVLGLIDHE